jgi:hypothetical protein
MSRTLSQLAAVITEELSHTMILIYKDCGARIIFESGNKIDTVAPAKDVEGAIKFFTDGTAGMPSPRHLFGPVGTLKIHRVPAELKTDVEVLEWFQHLPEVHIEFQNQVSA